MLAGTSTRTPRSSNGTTTPMVPRRIGPAEADQPGRFGRAQPSRYWRRAARISAARSLVPSAVELFEPGGGLPSRLGVALAQHRQDELLVQAGFALDGRPPRPQVAGVDAGAQEPACGRSDLHRVVPVEIADPGARRDDAVVLELGELFECDRRHRAQLLTVDQNAREQRGGRRLRRAGGTPPLARRIRLVGRGGAVVVVPPSWVGSDAEFASGGDAEEVGVASPDGGPGDAEIAADDGTDAEDGRRAAGCLAIAAFVGRPSASSAPALAASAGDSISPESIRSLMTRSGRNFSRCSRRIRRSSTTSSSKNLR